MAVWASTTLTGTHGTKRHRSGVLPALFGTQPATLGDAARAAKGSYNRRGRAPHLDAAWRSSDATAVKGRQKAVGGRQ